MLGKVIRKYRKERNFTQEEMAERLGVTASAVNKWEREVTCPDIALLAPIARLLEISTDTPVSYTHLPAAVLLKKAAGIESGSGVPNKTKVAKVPKAEVMKIAELKMPDLNAASVEAAYSMICGTARSMGIVVEE